MSTFTSMQKVMAIVPKPSAFISFCSSVFIVQYVLRDRKRRKLTYHRLLLGMSTSDIIGSLCCFVGTWPIPRGEAYLAAGTVQSCAAVGFFNQASALCTISYNASLAMYYILVIVQGWKENRIAKVEKYLHAAPVLLGLGTGSAAAGLKLLNGAGWNCWIASGLPNHPERHNSNYGIYRLAFLYADAWAIIFFLAIVMVVIYLSVLKQEKKLDKYLSSLSQKKRNNSKKIRNQAFLYVGCMYITWLFGSIFRLMQFAGRKPPNAIVILFLVFLPLQGFFNLIVYMYPRIARYRETGTPFMASFGNSKMLFSVRRLRKMSSTFSKTSSFGNEDSAAVGQSVSSTFAAEKANNTNNHETKVSFAADEEDNKNEVSKPTSDVTPIAEGTTSPVNIEDGNAEPLERDAMDELVCIVET